jgi:6-phosphogluconolactonase (cycloisomerase 2 family)
VVHPSGKFLYVTDVPPASNGNVLAYSIDGTTGALAPLTGSPFAVGPQPLAVSIEPQGKFAYVSLIGGPTIAGLTINSTSGALTQMAASPFPAQNPLGVGIDFSGKFLYVSNPNLNSVGAYTIDGTTGALTAIGSPTAAGTGPIGIAVSPAH